MSVPTSTKRLRHAIDLVAGDPIVEHSENCSFLSDIYAPASVQTAGALLGAAVSLPLREYERNSARDA